MISSVHGHMLTVVRAPNSLAYAEMRWILARILFEFDLRGSPTTANWIERQKSYGLWERIPLDVYFEPAREKR